MGFGMVRSFKNDSDRKSSYFKAVAFAFIEKFMTTQNRKGLKVLIRLLNKIEENKEDSIYSMKLQPEIKGLHIPKQSYDLIKTFVGVNEDGAPARDEITKHLQFFVKELEQITKSKKNECFMINQRMFFYCENQFFFDCLEFFFRKIVANFLLLDKRTTVQGLPVIDAVLKSLRIDSIEEHISKVVLNFEEDGQGIALKVLPLLLKIPIDVYVAEDGASDKDGFLKHVHGEAKHSDVQIKALVEKDGVKSESKDINFHENKPINLLL